VNAPNSHEVTELLLAWGNGDRTALDRLVPLVYTELHRIAERELNRENRLHTLQPTALVNEAFIKLIDRNRVQWRNRQQFFGVAAELMQHILIDYARKHFAAKRGGHAQQIPLDDMLDSPDHPTVEMSDAKLAELLALDDSLKKLSRMDPEKSRVVALRYIFGFSLEETCEALGLSLSTVTRHWRMARAFLKRELLESHDEVASAHGSIPAPNSDSAKPALTKEDNAAYGDKTLETD
jgi:RNA polymerase sigma factor (TIGR02999 family)